MNSGQKIICTRSKSCTEELPLWFKISVTRPGTVFGVLITLQPLAPFGNRCFGSLSLHQSPRFHNFSKQMSRRTGLAMEFILLLPVFLFGFIQLVLELRKLHQRLVRFRPRLLQLKVPNIFVFFCLFAFRVYKSRRKLYSTVFKLRYTRTWCTIEVWKIRSECMEGTKFA